jgi:MurNAc alpha-1-phosphate uridylyltransferase
MNLPLMIFAAGHGTRMRPLTDARPKPLIEVAGRTLLDRTLDHATAAGIARVVVNTHYLGDMIVHHLSDRPDIRLSIETDRALETGGGLKRALPLLGPGPVLAVNSDAIWTGANPFGQLAAAWQPDRMDALLLLLPLEQVAGSGQSADFAIDGAGRLTRHADGGGRPHAYTGAQIIRTDGLESVVDDVFSLNVLWRRMIDAGRLYGLIHDGGWCPVGQPINIAEAEHLLAGARNV